MRRLVLLILVLMALPVGALVAGDFGWGPVVITREDEQKLILRLSQARRVTQPGLSLRWPLIETVQRYDRRWLYLNTEAQAMQTKEGEQLKIDNYAIWRIQDAILFRRSFPGGMPVARERLDRAVRDDVREVIGRHTLTEILRDRRDAIMEQIRARTRETVAPFGIGIADVRINRTELPEETMGAVYARMKTERERLAKKNRAEGEEQARRIRAEAERDARVTVANAERDAMILRGQGDAEAARIYAEAYGQDQAFYVFLRSLEAYRKTIDARTTLVLSPKAEFFRFLESGSPDAAGAPPPVSAPPP